MALAGGRRFEHASRNYEWVARRRGNEIRLVAQDVAARGQILVVRSPVYALCLQGEPHGEYYMRSRPITPESIRREFDEALGLGWRPTEKGLPPWQAGATVGAWLEDSTLYRLIDGLWSILDAICRSPEWQGRLAYNTGEFVRVPPEYAFALVPELEGRLNEFGGLAVYVRDSDHGDGVPHLAIRGLASGRDFVLEGVAGWHRGWQTGQGGAAAGLMLPVAVSTIPVLRNESDKISLSFHRPVQQT